VDDLSSGRRENVPAGAEFVRMDIGSPELETLFVDAGGFDIVNHHAAQIDVRSSVADPRGDARTNIDGLLNVLECARRHGTGRVLFASSGGVVYGDEVVRPTLETAAKAPASPYGVSKLAGELYLSYYARVHGLEYVALRYGNVYGPRQDPHGEAGVVAIFCERIIAGEPLLVFGDGEQTRDYVYVGDVVNANMRLTAAALAPVRELDDRAYNIGSGAATSVNELARALMEATGRTMLVEHRPARAGELRHSCLDTTRIRNDADWAPGTTFREGLFRTYAHIAGEETVSA
jgi:UDP-glucose 4-epimerase